MKNRFVIGDDDAAAPTLQRFFDELGLRCCYWRETEPAAVCGDPASWMRPGKWTLPAGYVCHRHQRAGDVPIPIEPIYRRVTVLVEVQLAGVSSAPSISHAEAVERLDRAVALAGGSMAVKRVTSDVGQYKPPVVRFEKRRRRDRV